MLTFLPWLVLLGAHAENVRSLSDRFAPPGWQGNAWGPAATRARADGQLPPVAMTGFMMTADQWARSTLRDGDIVFRLGDARILHELFPFSRFLAGASGSRYSHTGIVAFEDGRPVVYDCTVPAVRRQPFAVWILDNVGAFGVKRLKPEWRGAIPGVLDYCRSVFEQQLPFDDNFALDDSALYCLEMTEKAFRSQGLALSEPVALGDMENAPQYPLCMMLFVSLSPWMLKTPLSLEQRVYLPGNERHGLWASSLLEDVYAPPTDRKDQDTPGQDGRLSLRGDLAILAHMVNEVRTSERWRSDREVRFGLRSRGTEVPSAAHAFP